MPLFRKDGTSIYYEIRGSGYPLLLLPPGGMNATIDFWQNTAFNAAEVLTEHFRTIAIDQRNAGGSLGPLKEDNPWNAYWRDHVGLLNHLGIERCHVLGCCIGASYALNLMARSPQRIAAAVLEQPIGLDSNNEDLWPKIYSEWAVALVEKRSKTHPDIDHESAMIFGKRMWTGDFVFSVTRDQLKACKIPMLVLPGTDRAHPTSIGREIAALAQVGEILEPWKEPGDLLPSTVARIVAFLQANTPA